MAFYRKPIASKTEPPWTKKRALLRRLQRLLARLLIFAGTLFVVGLFVFALFAAWISRDLPNPDNLLTRDIPQSTKIYDRTGKTLLYEIHGDEKRTLVRLEDVPAVMLNATVAIEDKKFYEHHGVYWRGLFRAAYSKMVHPRRRLQGASTLTQQFVKNALLTNERSVLRKIKEFILALQIERRYSKTQILQMYLNEIPYGSNLYGVEAASRAYFGKPTRDLLIDEAALLAAIPQQPDCYSPYGTGFCGDNRDRLVIRQHYILDLMAQQGYLTSEDADAAKKIETLKKLRPRRVGGLLAPHFVTTYVQPVLNGTYGQKRVEQGGLKVITTLDWERQQAAEKAVENGVAARGKTYGFRNAALVSLDPKTGQILAMVGSRDFFDETIDGQVNVTMQPRQPGSSFKPIVYAAGFVRGYLPETKLWDVSTTFKTDSKDYHPQNYDLKEHGPVSLRQALQWSLNIPAVKMLYLVGVGRALDFAETLGYTTFGDRRRFSLALVLGGGEVKPLEHAAAFGAFATEGVLYPTRGILRVEDPQGVVLEEWKPSVGERVMEPQITHLVSSVLSDNETRAPIFGLRNALTLSDRPVAAKTGTTSEFRDAWTVGYTPSLVTAVWVGNSTGTKMRRGADGSVVAAPIWQAYMSQAVRDMPVEPFTPPAPTAATKPALLGTAFENKIKIDIVSGKRATEFTPPDLIEERTYFEPHTILYYVDRTDPTGPAPTNPAQDPQFVNWETAVQTWVTKNNLTVMPAPPTEFDDVHTAQNAPEVALGPLADASSRSFILSPSVRGPRQIVRVEALLNNTLVGTSLAPPWEIKIHIPNGYEKGYYELLVRAIDDVRNIGTAQATLNLTAEKELADGISIYSPAHNTVWSRKDFPKAIQISLSDPARYQKLDINFLGTDGQRRLASSLSDLSPLTVIALPLGPPAGPYQLIVTGLLTDGTQAEEASVTVQITE